MTAAYFEDHPTDPDKVILRKPRHEDDDDIQEYKKPWVGLTDEERLFVLVTAPPTFMNHKGDVRETAYTFAEVVQKLTEKKLKEKNT